MAEYEVKKYVEAEKLQSDLAFSDTDLSGTMMTQASMYAHYASLSAKAQKQVDSLKLVLEARSAKLDQTIRDAAAENGEKITEKRIENEIAGNTTIIGLKKKLNEARAIADLAKNACEAFKQRRDMLVQIGVTMREEMKGQLRVSEDITNNQDADVKARAKSVTEGLKNKH
ncbi:hypothetical protein AY600_02055 [Phormidium willei BDU 130791]|nr:hypothetical protein AY600_02055 [Phormidium willei BDU 130791]